MISTRSFAIAAVAVFVVVAVSALVPVGRRERDRAIDRERRGLLALRRAVGPVRQRTPDGVRYAHRLTCLFYPVADVPSAIELCYDADGRLVEAIDRRRGEAPFRVKSLLWDPALAPVVTTAARTALLVKFASECGLSSSPSSRARALCRRRSSR